VYQETCIHYLPLVELNGSRHTKYSLNVKKMNLGYFKKLTNRYILKRIFIERLTEPVHLNIIAFFVWLFGSYRRKIMFDLVIRQPYAYSIMKATETALQLGVRKLTIIEFGVGAGGGLMNICRICDNLSRRYGMEYQVFGFDTGVGMPDPVDYRDHPELYKTGDYKMDRVRLEQVLPSYCKLIVGEVKDTVPDFFKNHVTVNAPIGFVSFDLDYYHSTKDALKILLDAPEKYLPFFPTYFDDIALWSHNSYCGAMLAIKEFNEEISVRKIEKNAFLPYTRVFKHCEWIEHIFFVHVLDASMRTVIRHDSDEAVLSNPYFR
jgi:hypothetical protein